MREIKFRAWDNKAKEWLEPEHFAVMGDGEVFSYGSFDDTGGLMNPKETTLVQYTGLKDKNGKEIYEGDIVQWLDIDYAHNELIEYKADMCAFTLDGSFINTKKELTIIGNIYENPELLAHL